MGNVEGFPFRSRPSVSRVGGLNAAQGLPCKKRFQVIL
jgi:hypothetical protein